MLNVVYALKEQNLYQHTIKGLRPAPKHTVTKMHEMTQQPQYILVSNDGFVMLNSTSIDLNNTSEMFLLILCYH